MSFCNVQISAKFCALLLVAAALTSCSITDLGKKDLIPVTGDSLKLRALTDAEKGGDLSIQGPFPEYNREEASPISRVFLVAGGAETPNYLQEIVDQRNHLITVGHAASEIVCFYVKPSELEYLEHKEQFDQLASKVDGFYLAAPHLIYRHLKAAAAATPNYVYLYAAGKGHKPIWVDRAEGPERELAKHHAEYFGQYRIDLAGGPSGHMNPRMRLEALRDGIAIQNLLFTPRYLIDALNAFPDETKKFVILQGSYSGGFVRSDFEELAKDCLSEVSNIVVLTASRHDRESFRSSPGEVYSHFGESFLKAALKQEDAIPNWEWPIVAGEVFTSVRRKEEELAVSAEEASNPVFFSSNGEPELIVEVGPESIEVAERLERVSAAEEEIVPID